MSTAALSLNLQSTETKAEKFATLKSHLVLVKSMNEAALAANSDKDLNKVEDEFYALMQKCKQAFVEEDSIYMAEFYFEYSKFILERLEKNVSIFNAEQLPNDATKADVQGIEEENSSVSSSEQQVENKVNSQNFSRTDPHFSIASETTPKLDGQKSEENLGKKCEENPQSKQQLENEENPSDKQQLENEPEQVEDKDFDICYANLRCALDIFSKEKERLESMNEIVPQSCPFTLEEVNRFILRCKSRLGDLYYINENYMQAVDTYREVITSEQQKQGHLENRGLAEIHYMIANCYLYENKKGCEDIAIPQFIKAVHILVNHLKKLIPSDQTQYELPQMDKFKVDRFAYLPKSTDDEQVKEIRSVINCLLDKIEDTHEQIAIRDQYEEALNKAKKQKVNSFDEATISNLPVKNLGTFGRSKKKPEIHEESQREENKTETLEEEK